MTYQIKIINEHFSDTAKIETACVVKAWQKATASALAIAADPVSHGTPFSGAEVISKDGDEQIGRYVVSVGAMPLKD